MKRIKIASLIFLTALMVTEAYAQVAKGDKLYDQLGYGIAIPAFKGAVGSDGKLDRKTMIRLANSYRLIGDAQNAEKYYSQIVESSNKPLYRLYYAQALQSNGKCEEAKKYFLEYDALVGNEPIDNDGNFDKRGRTLAASCDTQFGKDEAITLTNLSDLNTESLDFSPTYYKDGLVFVSSRGLSRASNNEDCWTGDNFMDLFYADGGETGCSFGETSALPSEINSKFHEGPVTFDKSGNTMYFTRNDFNKGKRGFNAKKVTMLKIYSADRDGDQWTNVHELSFNSKSKNHCHPTLSADGQKLYLSSDRTGGYGGHDLYVSEFKDGKWTKPRNLGPGINSAGNELFPFIHDDGTLYFSSNGLPGLGGLDLFAATPIETGDTTIWSAASNLGKPFNSLKDDFGFITDVTKTTGYLSSSREGGKGGDDIYCFNGRLPDNPALTQLTTSKVFVYDKASNATLEGATVRVSPCDGASSSGGFDAELVPVPNAQGEYTLRIIEGGASLSKGGKQTNDRGEVEYNLECNKEYCFYVVKDGYMAKEQRFFTGDCDAAGLEIGIPMEADDQMRMTGTILNQLYNNPVPNATVYLTSKCTGETVSALTDANGNYSFPMDCGCDYILKGEKVGVGTASKTASTVNINCNQPVVTRLLLGGSAPATPAPPTNYAPAAPGYNIYAPGTVYSSAPLVTNSYTPVVGDVIELEHIYYDFDKSFIRSEASEDLNKLISILLRYPNMRVELRSHTDSRATDEYNVSLSQRRADAAVTYLVNKGIDRSRLTARGYGENELRNGCANDVPCSELEHQRNRRTEFRVLGVSGVDVRYIENEPTRVDPKPGERE